MKYVINLCMLLFSTGLIVAMTISKFRLFEPLYLLMALALWGCCLFKFMFRSEDK